MLENILNRRLNLSTRISIISNTISNLIENITPSRGLLRERLFINKLSIINRSVEKLEQVLEKNSESIPEDVDLISLNNLIESSRDVVKNLDIQGSIKNLKGLKENFEFIEGARPGTYRVFPSNRGRGNGALFQLSIIEELINEGTRDEPIMITKMVIDYENSSIITGGAGYNEGEVLSIRISDLGGRIIRDSKDNSSGATATAGGSTATDKGESLSNIRIDDQITFSITSESLKEEREYSGSIVNLSDLDPEFLEIPTNTVGNFVVYPDTDGDGEGAEFELVLIEVFKFDISSIQIDYNSSIIINGGRGYNVGDRLIINTSQFGERDRPTDISFIITALSLGQIEDKERE